MPYDVKVLRSHFPALTQGAAHFDGPGGSQVPDAVGEAMSATITAAIANRGRVTAAERFADEVVLGARAAMADLLGADPGGIVFGRSMTSLTFDFARTLAKTWAPGDEVVVTRLDHDANIRPWVLAAKAVGAVIRWAEFDPGTGELPVENVERLLTARTRLVAVTAASNLIGTEPDIAAIAAVVHGAGALFFVDGVHFTAHAPVDVADMGADFYVCSPYKFLGPHCGVLASSPELLERLQPDKLLPSSEQVPERYELGTLPYEMLAGTTAAVDFLAGLGTLVDPDYLKPADRRAALLSSMGKAQAYEDALRADLEKELAALPGVTLRSRATHRTPTLLMTFDGRDAANAQRFLADRGVNAPSGSFYALEASRWMGLGDAGGLRVGLAPYSDRDDCDRLVSGLREFLAAG
ncbi:cysteine desulfurase family protein (TIGR01976 family) [Nakamurella sp. UYEF19]|uniref:cysteine desulfurase-like protein n=1 Tax=Nakamurella sp. UYEF19 TaxID=1756392 RepID=UPI003399325C